MAHKLRCYLNRKTEVNNTGSNHLRVAMDVLCPSTHFNMIALVGEWREERGEQSMVEPISQRNCPESEGCTILFHLSADRSSDWITEWKSYTSPPTTRFTSITVLKYLKCIAAYVHSWSASYTYSSLGVSTVWIQDQQAHGRLHLLQWIKISQ